MQQPRLVVGVDFGTDSVRVAIFDAVDGAPLATAARVFPRWADGLFCDPAANRFRQHPADHLESMTAAVREALADAPPGTAGNVCALTVDTTGSTPGPVDHSGVPLALTDGFRDDPDAMFVLWKDHTAIAEAEEINHVARTWGGEDFTRYSGGIYSSEWFCAKMLHVLRRSPRVRAAAHSWVEHCDWVPALLTGVTDSRAIRRSRCAAGHKAMWHAAFGGLPADEFLVAVDPLFAGVRGRLYDDTYTVDTAAGTLTAEWAERLGLAPTVVVGVGALDAHLGALGGEIRPGILSRVMGTSTCDMLVAPADEVGDRLIRGICGQVDGSILPGFVGLEAGQSAFGDVYAWFRSLLSWPLEHALEPGEGVNAAGVIDRILPALSRAAAALPVDPDGPIALDWLNGRRTPDADQTLQAAIAGLGLGTDAPRIFRALVEATAFGSRALVERFHREGLRIQGVIALGGIPRRSPLVMQVVADVLNIPIQVARFGETCALGSAMAAAAAAGLYPDVQASRDAMGHGFETEYRPDPSTADRYERAYRRYAKLGAFVDSEFTVRAGSR